MNIPKYWEYTNNNENVHFILLFSPYYWAQENEAKCDVIINHKPQLFQYTKMAHFSDARRTLLILCSLSQSHKEALLISIATGGAPIFSKWSLALISEKRQ